MKSYVNVYMQICNLIKYYSDKAHSEYLALISKYLINPIKLN